MEPVAIRSERRGRKRRRNDVQNDMPDRQVKKQVFGMTLKALVGRYVMKEFGGNGLFIGKVVCYDTGLYRIDYEDGDCEDMDSSEVMEILIEDGDMGDNLVLRRKKLDALLENKNVKENAVVKGIASVSVSAVDRVEASSLSERIDASSPSGLTHDGGNNEIDDGAYSSSDSCAHTSHQDSNSHVTAPVVPPPQLPPSSGSIGVPEQYASHLFSIYSFLRSFSIRLFLSPFELDDFVGSLNFHAPNTLLDAIHIALMRALRRHLQMVSADGSELASKCLRLADWNLLDTLTWPSYLVRYLMVMGYANGHDWKGFYIDVLEKEYYTLSAAKKLMVLQILCDDVLDSEELRAEVDMREESEVGIDYDAVAAVGSENGPRRVHPKYMKTSAYRDEGAAEIVEETHGPKSSSNSSFFGVKGTDMNVKVDIVNDGNGDECRLCGMDGTLLCCDGCPSAYHSRCIGVSKLLPEGAWYCPECIIDKIGPTLARGTSLRGAEIFGVDSHGQVFLGTCNHLLVFRVSFKSEQCLRYYNLKDIPKVLQALRSSVQHIPVYSEISRDILQYWDLHNEILPCFESTEMFERSATIQNDGECSPPSFTLLGKESNEILDPSAGEKLASSMTETRVGNMVASSLEDSHKVPGYTKSLLDTMGQPEHPGQQQSGDTSAKKVCVPKNVEFSEQSKVNDIIYSGSVIQQADSSDLTHQSLYWKPNFIESATCTSGNSDEIYEEHADDIYVAVNNTSSHNKEGSRRVSGRGYTNSSEDYSYMGSHFKPHAYVNNYTHGDFAASAAANLAILLPVGNQVSESHALDKRRKVATASNLLQVKAFSSAAIRFFWPNCEKKFAEVPRERCGWCLSCKAAVTCKKGCLLNAAVSNAIKGTMKILTNLRPSKIGEGTLPGIAMYVIFMEQSLRGLTVGLFRSSTYRKQWRKHVEQTRTCSDIKSLLLELEENIRAVALSGDWLKLVDDWSIESSVTQSVIFPTGSTQKRGPNCRRGRKRCAAISEVAISEVTYDYLQSLSDVTWWRGGMLSKLILQKGILPRSLVKKAARQGGYRKIPAVIYSEGFEIPKRSRQHVWRAAVEMSKNASELALQVRYLDLHVRWNDLVCPEQSLQEGKGPETEATAFRNAFVCDKKNAGDKIIYGVVFENQKQLPSRVMKNLIELVQSQDRRVKYWFSEVHIPLYLIKEYEEKLEKTDVPLVDRPVNAVPKLKRRQLKASGKDVFSYLACKRENLGKCCCVSCHLDVLFGNAVNCTSCQGFCHEQCTISSTVPRNGGIELSITCKQCYRPRSTLPRTENSVVLPTSPLVLQDQESQNAVTTSTGDKRKHFNQPVPSPCPSVGPLERSVEMKSAIPDSSLVPKNQRKICSWGLIWKKNKNEDVTTDFRSENMIFRDNSDMIRARPVCHLCNKPYNSDLVYIRCETCKNWYHAEAVELDESKIGDLVGFKCCRCRRIRIPVCPHMDPENKKKLEAKRPRTRGPKGKVSELDRNNGNTSMLESSNPKMMRKKEDPRLLLSSSKAEHITENNTPLDSEWNIVKATASETGTQKLTFRRHIKNANNINGRTSNNSHSMTELSNPKILPKAEEVVNIRRKKEVRKEEDALLISTPKIENLSKNNTERPVAAAAPIRKHVKTENDVDSLLPQIELSTPVEQNDLLNSKAESLSRYVKWDFPKNGFEDGALVDDYEGLNCEDVEFEPNTYFSFTELVYDDSVQLGEVDASGYVMGDWENSSQVSRDGCFTNATMACHRCLRKDPCPDLCCEICGLRMHTDCSPWVEQQSSRVGNWRCINCREWQ